MGLTVLASFVWRALLWWRYRPAPAVLDDALLPTVTVVIPAFNEGAMVTRSILSAIASDYPPERLRVVCVDDGSKDDTFAHMERARAMAPGRVTTLWLPHNRGKRHALFAGLRTATSEVVVTLDSDSVLPPHTLRALVAPLVRDAGTGSVAGCVKVYNRDENLLTRMLGVRYLLGFDFTRAYQSELGTVLCAPGALTAYRRSAIAPHLEAWRDQTFLGARCTNGDDHALTNVVLRGGWTTRYQGNAEVLTVVPETWRRLSRMYVRWARSNVRESTLYLRFGHRRAFARRDWLAWADALVHFLQIPARIWLSIVSTVLFFAAPHLVVRALAASTVVALVYGLVSLRSERGTESVYGILYAWMTLLTMHWIYPWAALTVRRNQWLTRGAGAGLEPAPGVVDNAAHARRQKKALGGDRPGNEWGPIGPAAPSPPAP
jgi:hyaluronan synthase